MLQEEATVRLSQAMELQGVARLGSLLALVSDIRGDVKRQSRFAPWKMEWARALQHSLHERLDATTGSSQLPGELVRQLHDAVNRGPERFTEIEQECKVRREELDVLHSRSEVLTLRLRCFELRAQCFDHLKTIFSSKRAS